MVPAATVLVPSVLVTLKLAAKLRDVCTLEVLLAAFTSVVPAVGAMVTVLVTVIFVAKPALTRAVMVTTHCAPGGALVNVPLTCVAPPTNAVAVVQVPPPGADDVILKTGVICVGKVSVNVAEAVTPAVVLVMISTYCTVCPAPTLMVVVTAVPVPALWLLATEKSVPTLYTAVTAVVLVPAVVDNDPAGIVLV